MVREFSDASGLSPLDTWLARLEKLSPREIVLGLERVQAVLEKLALRRPAHVFHIAGTNGKGSSVAMLRSLLRQSGVRVGSYTSPHVIRFNERICVDGHDATDAQIVAAFERIEAVRGDIPLTYFEFGTLAALVIFEEEAVDTAILEVGMGGRLDAVNAIEPDAGLITNVTLDHCDWLGNNVETIAFEKAGIMRSGKPTVYGSPELPISISNYAASIGAQLIVAGRDYQCSSTDSEWSWRGLAHELADLELPSLPGVFQITNAAGVLALVEASGRHELLQNDVVDAAFGDLQIIGRMQSVESQGNWILDVAHNPAAATALADTLRSTPIQGRTIAITGMLDDKDVAGIIAPLSDVVDRWIAVAARSDRSIEVSELARNVANVSNRSCLAADSIGQAIDFAREIARPHDRILVTGSFYVVGPVFELLRVC